MTVALRAVVVAIYLWPDDIDVWNLGFGDFHNLVDENLVPYILIVWKIL
jgi:hypothetical protein